MSSAPITDQPEKDNTALRNEVDRLRRELRRTDQAKRKFVALTAHELRNPLAILLGYAKMLEDQSAGHAREYAHVIVAQARQLKLLVDAMSTLQQYDLGELTLRLEMLMLNEIVREVIDSRQTELDEQMLVVKTRIEPDLCVRADRERLAMILTNLLSNAIKFSPRGGTINLDARVDLLEIIITVRDQGAGVPVEEQPHIFERFYQVSDPLTRHHQGLGLGLAVVKALVELHRGRIWVESLPSQGSAFHVSLPRGMHESSVSLAADQRIKLLA